MRVVLPASGCEMMAKVRRFAIWRSSSDTWGSGYHRKQNGGTLDREPPSSGALGAGAVGLGSAFLDEDHLAHGLLTGVAGELLLGERALEVLALANQTSH